MPQPSLYGSSEAFVLFVEGPGLFDYNTLLYAAILGFCSDAMGNLGHNLGMDLTCARAWLAATTFLWGAFYKAMLLGGFV
jgi:hypothetical protein